MDLAADYEPSEGSIGMCCCGRPDCAYRVHSCEVLQNYEKDARVAAELGQVSLLLCCRASLVRPGLRGPSDGSCIKRPELPGRSSHLGRQCL